MKNINPTHTYAWHSLEKHFEKVKNITIAELFEKDTDRFKKFSMQFSDFMFVDFSKNHITENTLNKLRNLAEEMNLIDSIHSMFSGDKINYTENRSVLHVALRNQSNSPIYLDNENIMLKINAELRKIQDFSEKIISGDWKGYTGKAITDIVNVGIGGSYLGPFMVTEALRPYKNHLNIHYISNIDGTDITEVLSKVNPESTFFLIASKNFSTQETITNANSALNWFLKRAKNSKHVIKHFAAISSNIKAAIAFGIDNNNIFEFWDWVNGRYSLWSAIGLSIVLSIGFDNFITLLSGAHAMDKHFSTKELKENLPVLLALISIWYTNFYKAETAAIIVYDQYMHLFCKYIQQVHMESNGKYIDRNGNLVNYQTAPVIWGELGTNSQHSFFQFLHQGTKVIPCDFIAPINTHNPISDHHQKLLSHFFAQTEALAFGNYKIIDQQPSYLYNKINKRHFEHMTTFDLLKGNRPTNSILLRQITPFNLGALIALYEHKIFSEGVILNIFSFDQWGVEWGKKIANNIFSKLSFDNKINTDIYSNSTKGLINFYKIWRNK